MKEDRKHENFKTINGIMYTSVSSALSIINRPDLNRLRGLKGNRQMDSILDQAIFKGKQFHYASHLFDIGEEKKIKYKELHPDVFKALEFYKMWFYENVESVQMSEVTMYCKKYKIKGTPDLIATLKGKKKPDVFDKKTGTDLFITIAWQLSGYKEIALENGIDTLDRLVLHCRPDKIIPITIDRKTHFSDLSNLLCSVNNYNAIELGQKKIS